MKRLPLFMILVLILGCCAAAAGEVSVTEVTPVVPTQIALGEDLPITVSCPGAGGILNLQCRGNLYRNESLTVQENGAVSFTVTGAEMVRTGVKPGSVAISFFYEDGQGRTWEPVCRVVQITGQSFVRPTIAADSLMVDVGDTVLLSGEAGDAALLELTLDVRLPGNGGGTQSRTVQVQPSQDGRWQYTVAAEYEGLYIARLDGITGEGLSLGGNVEAQFYSAGSEAGPAPEVTLASGSYASGQKAVFTLSCGTESVQEWDMSLFAAGDGVWRHYGSSSTVFFDYAGEYTLMAAYRSSGGWSSPALMSITVTGTPWPANGPAPIEIEYPDTFTAGTDAAFHVNAQVEGESFNFHLEDCITTTSVLSAYQVTGNSVFEVPGYLLQAGRAYRLFVDASADGWENNRIDYCFIPQASPSRPQAPVLSPDQETVYLYLPFTVTADSIWDEIAWKAVRTDASWSRYSGTAYGTDRFSVTLEYEGEYILTAYGRRMGIWSECSQPLSITPEMMTVTELTVTAPESIQLGQDFEFTIVCPDMSGRIGVRICEEDNPLIATNTYLSDRNLWSGVLYGYEVLDHDITPGSYTAIFFWEKSDGEIEEISRPLVITGETPQPPTAQAEPAVVAQGGSFLLSGRAGDAVRLVLEWSVTRNGSWISGHNHELNANDIADGQWQFSVPADEAGEYDIFVFGYNGSGLSTGSISLRKLFAVGDGSLTAPRITLTPENPENNTTITAAFSEMEGQGDWYEVILSSDGGEYTNNYFASQPQVRFSVPYGGDYTLTLRYRVNGVWSAPALRTVTVGGTPWPSHGKVPMDVTLPPSAVASVDLTVELAYAAEQQVYSYDLYYEEDNTSWHLSERYNIRDASFTIPGYLLQAGKTYVLHVSSNAYDWLSNLKYYYFTAGECPAQVPAPVPSISENTVFQNIPFTVQLGNLWDRVAWQIREAGSDWVSMEGTAYGTDQLEMILEETGEFELTVYGCLNGVWGAASEPLAITAEDLAVTELTVIGPETVRLGEDYVFTVAIPEYEGEFFCSFGNEEHSFTRGLYPQGYAWRETIPGPDMIHGGIAAGTYTVTIFWERPDGQMETVAIPLTVTGETPAEPTIFQNSLAADVGGSILLHGSAGTADYLTLDIQFLSIGGVASTSQIRVDHIQESQWQYSLPLTREGEYRVTVTGWTDDGLATGTAESGRLYALGSTGLPAPAAVVVTDEPVSGQRIDFQLIPGLDSEDWHICICTADGGYVMNLYWNGSGTVSAYAYLKFAGEYILTAAYRADGHWSAPAVLPFTVSGQPGSIQDKAPVAATVHGPARAHRDLQIDLEYPVPEQYYSISLYDYRTGEWFFNRSGIRQQQTMIPGYALEAGRLYMLEILAIADEREDGSRTLFVAPEDTNGETPAPAFTLPDGDIWEAVPAQVSLDGVYEQVHWVIREAGYEYIFAEGDVFRADSFQFVVEMAGDFELTVYGKSDGIWSEASQTAGFTVTEMVVEELTVSMPSSIMIGEDLAISVFVPEYGGYVTVEIVGAAYQSSFDAYMNGNHADLLLEGWRMLENGARNGMYTVTFTYENDAGETAATLSLPLSITGDVPTAPTVAVDQSVIAVGESFSLYGLAGDAVGLDIRVTGDEFYQMYDVKSQDDGRWSLSFTPPGEGDYQVRVRGFAYNGRCTGVVYLYSLRAVGSDTWAAPAVTVSSDSFTTNDLLVFSFDAGENVPEQWQVTLSADGKDFSSSWTFPCDGSGHSANMEQGVEYASDYTLTVSYQSGDRWSFPGVAHFTVTGTPWPSHGKLPIDVTLPDTITAHRDFTLHLGYVDENQFYSINLFDTDTHRGLFDAGGIQSPDFRVPGYYLEPDHSICLSVASYAEDWEVNHQTYFLTVSPDTAPQPEPPILTAESTAVSAGKPFTVMLNSAWDSVFWQAMYAGGSDVKTGGSEDNADRLNVIIQEEGQFEVIAYGCRNGIWSAASQPLSITVQADTGMALSSPVLISAPEQVQLGDTFTVSVLPVENAEWYSAIMYQWEPWSGRSAEITDVTEDAVTFTFSVWPDSFAAGMYQIHIFARAEGYDCSGAEIWVDLIVDGQQRLFELPAGLKTIEEEAFAGSTATYVVIPYGCESIGPRAFAGCTFLHFVVIPETVTYIADDAFENCPCLAICTSEGTLADDYASARGIWVSYPVN